MFDYLNAPLTTGYHDSGSVLLRPIYAVDENVNTKMYNME
jgi:hypothetical protein